MEPRFHVHAGRRILKRGIDAKKVYELAKDALASGFAKVGKRTELERWGIKVVMAGDMVITAYRRNRKGNRKGKRNERKKGHGWKTRRRSKR